jgi:hypothetical protein
MTTDKDRAEFEKFAAGADYDLSIEPAFELAQDWPNRYLSKETRNLARGWQAARSRSGAVPAGILQGIALGLSPHYRELSNAIARESAALRKWGAGHVEIVPHELPLSIAAKASMSLPISATDFCALWESVLGDIRAVAEASAPEPPQGDANAALVAVEMYATSARVISLHLQEFCDKSLPYPDMIADAARKAGAEIERLRADTPRSGDAPVAAEPYAFEFEQLMTDSMGGWERRIERTVPAWAKTQNVRPLYTTPPADARDADAARFRKLLPFLDIDDIGDEETCLSLIVRHEALEEAAGAPRFDRNWDMTVRDVIDAMPDPPTDSAMGAGGGA